MIHIFESKTQVLRFVVGLRYDKFDERTDFLEIEEWIKQHNAQLSWESPTECGLIEKFPRVCVIDFPDPDSAQLFKERYMCK